MGRGMVRPLENDAMETIPPSCTDVTVRSKSMSRFGDRSSCRVTKTDPSHPGAASEIVGYISGPYYAGSSGAGIGGPLAPGAGPGDPRRRRAEPRGVSHGSFS